MDDGVVTSTFLIDTLPFGRDEQYHGKYFNDLAKVEDYWVYYINHTLGTWFATPQPVHFTLSKLASKITLALLYIKN